MTYLCLDKDLPAKGDFRTMCADGIGSVVVITKDGHPVVAKNECRHRGFQVCEKEFGTLPIDCPYHGQRFFFEKKTEAFVFNNFVFLKSLETILPPAIKAIRLGNEFFEKKMIVGCSRSMWIQNTMDCNHLEYVHKDGFANVFAERYPVHMGTIEGHSSFHELLVKPEIVEFYRKHCDVPRGTDLYAPERFTHSVVGPNLSVTTFLGIFTSIEIITPVAKNFCSVHTRFFTTLGVTVSKHLLRAARIANERILEEDKAICERWAQGNPTKQDVVWMSGEERIRQYVATQS